MPRQKSCTGSRFHACQGVLEILKEKPIVTFTLLLCTVLGVMGIVLRRRRREGKYIQKL